MEILTIWTIEYRNVLVRRQMLKQSDVTSAKKVTSITNRHVGSEPSVGTGSPGRLRAGAGAAGPFSVRFMVSSP